MIIKTSEEALWEEYEQAVTDGNVPVVGEVSYRNESEPPLTEDDLRALFTKGRPSVGSSHARGTGRSPVIQFSVSEEDVQRLDEYASNHGMRRAEAARHAVHLMLANA